MNHLYFLKMKRLNGLTFLIVGFILASFLTNEATAIRCYQCSTATDGAACAAYGKFDKEANIAVDCNSYESSSPGSFCMKVTRQSPRGFIWDGRWRQVIRRCASVSESGVTGVCNWGIEENGVYWEECYCSEDGCNSAPRLLQASLSVLLMALFIAARVNIY